MFDSSKYKLQAKKQLAGRYTTASLATLISALIILAAEAAETENTLFLTASVIFSTAVCGIVALAYVILFNEYYRTSEKLPLRRYIQAYEHSIKGAGAMLWYGLWVTLWSLLFIIPGIVKSFAYSQMFFVIAENPKISISKAMKISKIITRGHKADLFFMGLSFIFWEILSVFTLGILQLWLTPYQIMSFTNAYKELKSEAIKTGFLTLEDFN